MKSRARSSVAKHKRRTAILDAALEIWAECASFAAFNMADVARRAGVAKGTVYLYFETKESLLFSLLVQSIATALDQLDAALDKEGPRWTPKRVASAMSSCLIASDVMMRLMRMMGSTLEHNVSATALLEFKRQMRDRVLQTGLRLERRLPFLGPGEGVSLLRLCYAMGIGLHEMANPSAKALDVLNTPELAVLQVDFGRELPEAIHFIVCGLQRTNHGRFARTSLSLPRKRKVA